MEKGIYEKVISAGLAGDLSGMDPELVKKEPIDEAESSQILADYVASVLKKKLAQADSKEAQIELVNSVLDGFDSDTVLEPGAQLLAVLDGSDPLKKELPRPKTSMARSSLFTGSHNEPQVFTEFKKEILTCSRIDMLVSFIRWSGLRMILDELKEFTASGGKLRVITTSYMGATEVKAIEELSKLPNTEIRVSYDAARTRLHAKAYIYYRNTGYDTAYVGSSNLTNPAISSGLEWNTKITRQDLPETMQKISATFESYWNSPEFERYDKEKLTVSLRAQKGGSIKLEESGYALDVRPYPYQQEILDKLEVDRTIRHNRRNLVVAATGTGKTVISAFDYLNYTKKHPGKHNRLLFIAHREEILVQSLRRFRAILKDPNFGDLYVGHYRPEQTDHLFMSIQTFNASNFLEKVRPDFYDFIIVDEFHHSAAPSYRRLLDTLKPDILVGLTATPERMDGKNIAQLFHGHISAEIRLPEAIERKLLVPFQYFGVSDTIDLDAVKWTNGGYDKTELTDLYIHNQRRAEHILDSVKKYCTEDVKGLGFCVSIKHAQFMADHFNSRGIPSICLTGNSDDELRSSAQKKLVDGQIQFIFVVDLYNEGVDIPEVNTVLFLRPTESLTIFLQQLGRGLRLAPGKDCLTVLDFIGQAHKRYDFESKFTAISSGTGKGTMSELKNGFPNVPKGCFIQLEKMASSYVLNNIKQSIATRKGIQQRMETFVEDTGKDLNLPNFLSHYNLKPRQLYKIGSFYKMATDKGLFPEYEGKFDKKLSEAFGRFADADSSKWISFIKEILKGKKAVSKAEKRMRDMLLVSLYPNEYVGFSEDEKERRLDKLRSNAPWKREMEELMDFQFEQIDTIELDYKEDVPLEVHSTYTRDQLLTAFGYENPSNVREGVKWLKDQKTDIFMVTLNKAEKDYSPTTMYEDYSINDTLFHWQSQSHTSENSPTGQRYIHHDQKDNEILLFVREFKKDRTTGKAGAYTFLGPAHYVNHTGSSPMSIVWKLDHKIPAKYMKTTNKLMA